MFYEVERSGALHFPVPLSLPLEGPRTAGPADLLSRLKLGLSSDLAHFNIWVCVDASADLSPSTAGRPTARNIALSLFGAPIMADANHKITIFFESQGGTVPTGWTETFWTNDANIDSIADKVKFFYIPKRVGFLGLGASAKYLRISKMPLSSRISKVFFLDGKQGENSSLANPKDDGYDPTQVDLLFLMADAEGHRRSFYMSGLPDKYSNQLVKQGMEAAFLNGPLFTQFTKAIRDSDFVLRSKVPGSSPAEYNTYAILRVEPRMVRNRKRGRPFFLFRGRRAV